MEAETTIRPRAENISMLYLYYSILQRYENPKMIMIKKKSNE